MRKINKRIQIKSGEQEALDRLNHKMDMLLNSHRGLERRVNRLREELLFFLREMESETDTYSKFYMES